MNAVKWPGSLYLSAAAIVLSQVERYILLSGQYMIASGNVPRENESMIARATSIPLPSWTFWYHSLPVGSARIVGLPANRSGKKPMLSE
jgi:hypothetical protein